MDSSTIHRTPAATDRSPRARLTSWILLSLASAFVLLNPGAAQKTAGNLPIDLTTPGPPSQQGLGVPGNSGGGIMDGPLAGPIGPPRYELPLRAEIIRTSVSKDNDFILELQLENTGQAAFNLPVSRNISDVQGTPAASRRQFYFAIWPVSLESREAWTVAVIAGSASMHHSFLRLNPQESIRVLLRVESNRVKKAMPREAKQLDVRVVCSEWTLDDNRFFIHAKARDLASANIATLRFQDDTPVAPTSQR